MSLWLIGLQFRVTTEHTKCEVSYLGAFKAGFKFVKTLLDKHHGHNLHTYVDENINNRSLAMVANSYS